VSWKTWRNKFSFIAVAAMLATVMLPANVWGAIQLESSFDGRAVVVTDDELDVEQEQRVIVYRNANIDGNVKIAAGGGHTLLLDGDSRLWAWGSNEGGELGISTEEPTELLTAKEIDLLVAAIEIAAGDDFSLAIGEDGQVYAWGNNYFGQLGDSTEQSTSYIPEPISNVTGAEAIAAGNSHGLAVDSQGKVWAWGYNSKGQAGVVDTDEVFEPQQLSSLSDIVELAAGMSHSVALDADGRVWAWGDNTLGQLGNSSVGEVATPIPLLVQFPEDAKPRIVAIASSTNANHTLALDDEGNVWAWGYGRYNEIGNGTTFAAEPVIVLEDADIVSIAVGEDHSLALSAGGTVWSWGSNLNGQLGIPALDEASSPSQVLDSNGKAPLDGIVAIGAGAAHNIAVTEEGIVWAWGSNDHNGTGLSPLGIGLDDGVYEQPTRSFSAAVSYGNEIFITTDWTNIEENMVYVDRERDYGVSLHLVTADAESEEIVSAATYNWIPASGISTMIPVSAELLSTAVLTITEPDGTESQLVYSENNEYTMYDAEDGVLLIGHLSRQLGEFTLSLQVDDTAYEEITVETTMSDYNQYLQVEANSIVSYFISFIDEWEPMNTEPDPITVEAITVSGAEIITSKSGTAQYEATITPDDADEKSVEWSVENRTGQATITATGLLTAVADGTVIVKATAKDGSGIVGQLTVTISGQSEEDQEPEPILVEAITVTGTQEITSKGGTAQYVATITPDDADEKSVEWTVENGTGQATITATGLLTAVADGTVIVKATAKDGSGVVGQLTVIISGQSEVEPEPTEDTEAPAWGAESKVTASEVTTSSVKLIWSGAADNAAVTGYKVTWQVGGVNKVKQIEGEAATTTISDLQSNTSYTFKVEAVDEAGNWSQNGPSVTVRTNSVYVPPIDPGPSNPAPSNPEPTQTPSESEPEGTEASEQENKPEPTTTPEQNEQPAQPAKVEFFDVPATHWAHSAIQRAAALGIVQGNPDGSYKPNEATTRAEFITMLAKAFKWQSEENEASELSFQDNDNIGAWAKDAIAQGLKRGIVTGYTDGSFRPNQEITRTEMIVMIARALGIKASDLEQTSFSDDDNIPAWAKGAVESLREQGHLAGRSGNSFAPNEAASRAEALVIILRVLKL